MDPRLIAILVLLIANFLDLHALAAAASSGFILVFLMVNIANAKLAKETGSKRWICILGALVCFSALAILLIQIARNPAHRYELWFIGALIVFPFLYQSVFNTYKHFYEKKS
jgi:hypothetical protein